MSRVSSNAELGSPCPPPVASRPTGNDSIHNDSPTSGRSGARSATLVTTVEKGGCPVDAFCPVKDTAHVVTCEGGFFDVTLTFTDAKKNSNKFFVLHVLRNDESLEARKFYTWIRWGRIGEKGRTSLLEFDSLPPAVEAFESKFEAKSGLAWADRSNAPVKERYARSEPAYAHVETPKTTIAARFTVASQLPEALQQLLRLMFDESSVSSTLSEFDYDSDKMPLGRLSSTAVDKGKALLQELSTLLQGATRPRSRIFDLTNQYLTIIPHSFARSRPPLLNTAERVEREKELLDAIESFQFNDRHAAKSACSGAHPLDEFYKSLGHRLELLDDSCTETLRLKRLLQSAQGPTHHQRLDLIQAFKIDSSASVKRQDKALSPKLLFFATRAAQYGPILQRGLAATDGLSSKELKPFGKRGIYLTPVASKAAQNCYHQSTGNKGLILVVEAILEDSECESRTKPDLHFKPARGVRAVKAVGKVKTDWSVSKDFGDEVEMPRLPSTWEHANPTSAFMYDEFAVYDDTTLKMRYLIMVKFVDNRLSYY
ncbi:hypothetical protein ACM66B_006445 [Microbotryomycetes sp. NB124-2]